MPLTPAVTISPCNALGKRWVQLKAGETHVFTCKTTWQAYDGPEIMMTDTSYEGDTVQCTADSAGVLDVILVEFTPK